MLSDLLLFIIENYCRYNKKTLLQIIKPHWFEDVNKFPHIYPCKYDCDLYYDNVIKGYNKMKETKIIFAGLCINIESHIPRLKSRIEFLGKYFKQYIFLIFENDSTDNTRKLIKNWTNTNPNVILIPCEENIDCKLKVPKAIQTGTFSSNRMKRMAEYRNRIINYSVKYYSDYDYLMMFDLDIDGPWSIGGFADSFGKSDQWDAVTAFGLNGITATLGHPIYYDLIAYRDNYVNVNINKFDMFNIFSKMSNIENRNKLIKTTSSFGGLAIYKMEIFNNNINYTPIDDVYICEHIILSDNMIRNGYDKIYINPNMIILVGVQGDVDRYPWY